MTRLHRTRTRLASFVLIMSVGCGHTDRAQPAAMSARERTCSNGTSLMLSDSGIGLLRLGVSADTIRAGCVVFRDTTELAFDGTVQRVLHTQFGPAMMYVEIVNSRVARLSTTNPLLLTEDGLGAGSSLESLLLIPNASGFAIGNSVFVRVPNHCGLGFQLDSNATHRMKPGATVDERALRKLPLSTKIVRVLISGC